MKVFDLKDKAGRVFAFEVKNTLLGRMGVCRAIRAMPGTELTKMPRRFSWMGEDEFCEFELEGQTFVVYEPFGDSSRY